MRTAFSIVVFCVTVSALAGCTTMRPEQCLAADWRNVGLQDGTTGQPLERFLRYGEDCAEAGVTPDKAAYVAGRNEGLESYCTVRSGYNVGSSGGWRRYHHVCPDHLEPAFLLGFRIGQRADAIRNQHREVERQLEEAEDLSRDKSLSDEGRRRVRDEVYRLRREKRRIEAEWGRFREAAHAAAAKYE